MDPVTHAALGATVSLAGFRRRLGRRALVLGALMAMTPDADIVVGWIAGPFANWQYHRGLTHSVGFAVVVGPLFGWLIWRLHRARGQRQGPAGDHACTAWMGLFTAVLITHPLIDLITHYGTQLLAPFSDHRFALPAMPIIDPVFSLILVAAALAGLLVRRRVGWAVTGAWAALIACWAYALAAWVMNEAAADAARRQLAAAGVAGAVVEAYPTLFQPYLRRVVARQGERVAVGYYSVLAAREISWTWANGDETAAVRAVVATEQARVLSWFARGQVLWRVVEGEAGREVQGTDLRYGYPGGSEFGQWGVRALLTRDGALAGPPEMLRRRPTLNGESLGWLWRMVVG